MTPHDFQKRYRQTEQVELIRLFSALEGNLLSDEEFSRLDQVLATDEEARVLYRRFIALHDDLAHLPIGDLERIGQTAGSTLTGVKSSASNTLPWRFLAVVMSLAASVAVFWSAFSWPPAEVASAVPEQPLRYVATVRAIDNPEWHSDSGFLLSGSRLLPGDYSLESGSVEVKFDCGGTLVLHGPTDLVVIDESSARVEAGHAVFRSDGAGLHFRLSTPQSSFMHFGTEYAVAVNSDTEELHVLEGEVHRILEDTVTDKLSAGQAMTFTSRQHQEIPIELALFSRTPSDVPPTSRNYEFSADDLIAHEDFTYPSSDVLQTKSANGGKGWTGKWLLMPGQLNQNSGFFSGLDSDQPSFLSSWGGYCRCDTGLAAVRVLSNPIRMDRDNLVYFSCKFRFEPKLQPVDGSHSEFMLVFRRIGALDTPFYKEGLRFLVHNSYLVVSRRNDFSRLETTLLPGQDYLLAGKVVCRKDQPDQILASVIAVDTGSPLLEPESMSVVSPAFRSDERIDGVTLHIHTEPHTQYIDDIRIGRNWESVTAPIPEDLDGSLTAVD